MLIIDNQLTMATTRFVKPKIDKYIQLYSKYARVEDGTFTGKIGNIIVTNGGQWYDDENSQYPPIVSISPPDITSGGIQATATVKVDEGQLSYPITQITITNPGYGYINPPTITITAPTFDGDATNTNDGIMYVSVQNGGSGYTSVPTITISAPVFSGIQATATATILNGVISSVVVTNAGRGYNNTATVTVTGGGGSGAILKGILYRGFGATALAQITQIPLTAAKYTWQLESPIEINENALIQIVDRAFTDIPTADANKPIAIRMYDISSQSTINTQNLSTNNTSFYQGKIIDIGQPVRTFPNDIKLEIQPQVIDKITLSLNHGISTSTGVSSAMEFVIMIKITEKEPTMLEFGSLNNINTRQLNM
jgi:hypothetical protein